MDFGIDENAVASLSEARLEQQISEVIDSTNNALASSKANDPEVDTFEAINQAARGLTGEAGDKCLYILDSGLSTEGELNVLSENLHRLIDVQPIVDKLQKDHALPDLTGVQVVWIGLGDAADKQEDLTSRNKNTLKELWEAVLTTSGAEVTFKNLPLTEEGSTDITSAVPCYSRLGPQPDLPADAFPAPSGSPASAAFFQHRPPFWRLVPASGRVHQR